MVVSVTAVTVICVLMLPGTGYPLRMEDLEVGFSLGILSLPPAALAAAFGTFGITGVGASELGRVIWRPVLACAAMFAVVWGVRSLWSPFSPQTTQFPEHRPYAALDEDPSTAWIADRALETGRHWMDGSSEGSPSRPRSRPNERLVPAARNPSGSVRPSPLNLGRYHSRVPKETTMRPRIWTSAVVILSAALASILMLVISPLDNQAAGFALWFVFFVVLLWPARIVALRRFGPARRT